MAQPLDAANSTPSQGGGTPSGPPPVLACTRFNNKTWQEYQDWLNTNQQTYEQTYQRPLKCIYGTPREISHKKIPAQAKILVIEMNNDENKIEGIGQIENQTASEVYRPAPLPFRKIFSDRNYSRYLYIGNTHYASREELIRNHTTDAQYINEQLIAIKFPSSAANATAATSMKDTTPPTTSQTSQEEARIQSLERLLFKGAKHMKRGSGITRCKFM
jgi:hypothetical protein